MNLKELRKGKGYTQKALADDVGMNVSQIQRLEYGEIDVGNTTLRNALKLAAALDVAVEELIKLSSNQ